MKKFIFILYAAFLLLFTIFSYAFVDPNLSYLRDIYTGFAFTNRSLITVFYTSFILIFFIFYGTFIFLGVKKRINIREILLLLGITTVILLFSYSGMLSYDIFNYMATSKVLFLYHENPYIIMPIEFLGDPLLAFMHAANKIALYGPFWVFLTGIPYSFGQGNFIALLFGFKLLNILFYSGTIFLIWKMSKNIISLILFALNPLVVIETLVSGHNDIVMIFLALFSLFLLIRKKILLGILLFILSILIKYATLFLLPVVLFMVWRVIRKRDINSDIIFYYSSILMFVAFLLSPIREEIYSWYAIWFISFAALIPNKKILLYIFFAFSLSLLLRYTPYMFTGTYAGLTPFMKEIISFAFPILVFVYYGVKKKV